MLVGRAELRPEIACAKPYIDWLLLFSTNHCPFFSLVRPIAFFLCVCLSPYIFPFLIPDFQHVIVSIKKARALGPGCSVWSGLHGNMNRLVCIPVRTCRRTPPWNPSFQFCLQFPVHQNTGSQGSPQQAHVKLVGIAVKLHWKWVPNFGSKSNINAIANEVL